VVDTGAGACGVTRTVGGAVGAGVAPGVFVPLPVQPATAIEAMSTATRLMVRNKCERFLIFMVFIQIMNQGEYTLFRHKL